MRHVTVKTTNILRLMNALDALLADDRRVEGMGVVHGEPGEGKSTAVAFAVIETRGAFIRARASWTMTSMYDAICHGLGLPTHPHSARMLDAIIERLADAPRPLFIDEADYLTRPYQSGPELLDALRDIYDLAQVPVVLIGHADFPQKIGGPRYSRFFRRVTQWVPFTGLGVRDVQRAVGALAEVEVEGAMPVGSTDIVPIEGTLVEAIYRGTRGNIGKVVNEIDAIERWARTNSREVVTLEEYGTQRLRYKPAPSGEHVAPLV